MGAIWIPEYITNGVVESGSSGTLQENLPEDEQISMIMLELRATRAASPDNDASIFDCFSKIEVVADGVKEIASAEPEILDYAAFVAQGGISPDHRLYSGGSAVCRLHLPIYFGRFPWDEEYLLDTSRYSRVQIKISWNLATSLETFTSFTHTITYWRPLEKLSPKGFVRTREIEKVSSPGNNATKKVLLPNRYPWHYLFVRVEDLDQDINTNLSTVDLRADGGRLHLADVDVDELYYADKLRWAHARPPVIQPTVTGQDNILTFADWGFVGGTAVVSGNRVVVLDQLAGEKVRATVYVADSGAQASDAIPFMIRPNYQNPHKCLTLYDGRKEPFPAPDHSDTEVEFKTGSTGPDNLLVAAQELAPLEI